MSDKPMAAAGLTSYRYRMDHGFVMIGARNDGEALQEAARSTANVTCDRLEVYRLGKYLPVKQVNPALCAIRDKARAAVERDGLPVVILNLNPYRPTYVIREWSESREFSRDYVETVRPL